MTEGCWNKARGYVAGIAILVGRHMVGRRCLAPRGCAIVARITITGDARVIESGTGKCCGVMAHGAILCGLQVALRHAGRGNTIVTGRTIIDDTAMIEHRRCKAATRGMTDAAVLGCRHVGWIHLCILTRCVSTIVAGVTAFTHDCWPGVVYKGTKEAGRVMAHPAILAIRGRMTGCHADCPGPVIIMRSVVARDTVTGDTRMIEDRWIERSIRVTNVAILSCW